MCVLVIRSFGDLKDGKKLFYCMYFKFKEFYIFQAIYFDPSPKYCATGPPKVLDELKKPVFNTFTRKYGVSSGNYVIINEL